MLLETLSVGQHAKKAIKQAFFRLFPPFLVVAVSKGLTANGKCRGHYVWREYEKHLDFMTPYNNNFRLLLF